VCKKYGNYSVSVVEVCYSVLSESIISFIEQKNFDEYFHPNIADILIKLKKVFEKKKNDEFSNEDYFEYSAKRLSLESKGEDFEKDVVKKFNDKFENSRGKKDE